MECPFVENQQVVALGSNWEHRGWLKEWPRKDQIYTIREIVIQHSDGGSGVGLRFVEIHNPSVPTKLDGVTEPSFAYSGFRPLIDLLQCLLESRQRSKKRSKRLENV